MGEEQGVQGRLCVRHACVRAEGLSEAVDDHSLPLLAG